MSSMRALSIKIDLHLKGETMKKLVLSKETIISDCNLENITAGGTTIHQPIPTEADGCSTWGSCPTKIAVQL